MKLADIFVVVNGHTLGPFLTLLPQDQHGRDVEIDDGGEVHVVIAPRTSSVPKTRANGTLRRV